MAYCRFSSMDGKCNVYAYEDVYGGYTIHLAGRKRTNIDKAPPYPDLSLLDKDLEEFKRQDKIRRDWDESEGKVWENLKLKHASRTFREDSLEDFRDRLIYLRELGYTFPDYVFDCIEEEMQDEQA